MPTASRRRLDPLDPDASLDGFSSDELEETVFGPDPDQPKQARTPPRPKPRPTKFCHACAETLDARAEICPSCGVRQPSVGRTRVDTGTRNTAILLALASLLLGGVMLHKFYLDRTAAGVLSIIFFWTGIPWVASLVNLISYLKADDETFDRRFA